MNLNIFSITVFIQIENFKDLLLCMKEVECVPTLSLHPFLLVFMVLKVTPHTTRGEG